MNISAEQLRLYAVSDRSWLNGQTLEQAVEEILAAGATCLQLREKNLDREAFVEQARRLKPICTRFGVPLIINDEIDVCLAADADGVHVGQSDAACAAARAALGPGKIVGVSCHNVAEALAAQEAGADYLGCGAVFATGTKTNVTALSHEELRRICAAVQIPVVAIGGITAENIASLRRTGIAGVAVVSALFAPADKTAAARVLLEQVRRL